MNYPKRPKQHTIEDESSRIFKNILSNELIDRIPSNRDYGIDYYIEIAENNKVTGKLLAVQLKGSDNPKIVSSDNIVYYEIKESTLNYWYSLPIPVIFVYINTKTHKVYYTNIKKYIRNNYNDFKNEKCKNIEIPLKQEISLNNSYDIFNSIYLEEIKRKEFEIILIEFIASINDNCNFMQEHSHRDPFYTLDYDDTADLLRFLSLYDSLEYLSNYLGVECKVDTISQIIKNGQQLYGKDNYFYESEVSKVIEQIEPIFKVANKRIYNLLLEENEYWNIEHKMFLKSALNVLGKELFFCRTNISGQ